MNFRGLHLERDHIPPGAQESRGNHSGERERLKGKQDEKLQSPNMFAAASRFLDPFPPET